jgi:uncharacterized Zn-binding protein involved in type VI secretion
MGKPAARIGDMTAHGGTVVAGTPTVLIGGMPAARIGDMHVCPMMTPAGPAPIPHVGMPVSLGSTGVLIGGMPAARVGDMAVCAGPPDTIAMGCFTVLIGEAGGGGGGGGGAGFGMPASAAAHASAATAMFDNIESTTKEEHWVEIKFVDKAGKPVSGVPYKLTDPDKKESEGVLRMDGTIRRDATKEGQAEVILMNVSNAKWSKEKAEVGEKVKLSAETEGFEDGTLAEFQIFKKDNKGADSPVETIKAKVKSDKIEVEWVFEYPVGILEMQSEGKDTYSSPQFYFEILIKHCKAVSGLMQISDSIEIALKDETGKSLGNEEYIIILSDGKIRNGKLDSNGQKKEEKIPIGPCKVRFLNIEDFKIGRDR